MHDDSLFIFQKGFNYSQDGPGNRLVYHLSGCNMHCPWCANPEGLSQCDSSTKITVDELVAEAVSSKLIFIDAGGVTFTGGEASLQKEAVLKAINRLKAEGISTCIETNASLPNCEDLLDAADYVIADYKTPSNNRLKEIYHGEISTIEENLLFRAKTGKPLLVRIPLVHYFNCSREDTEGFIRFFKRLQNEATGELNFEILPYHEFGKEKYIKAGMEYTVTDGFVTDNDIKKLASAITNADLMLINT